MTVHIGSLPLLRFGTEELVSMFPNVLRKWGETHNVVVNDGKAARFRFPGLFGFSVKPLPE